MIFGIFSCAEGILIGRTEIKAVLLFVSRNAVWEAADPEMTAGSGSILRR
jgi:hypothetical protein